MVSLVDDGLIQDLTTSPSIVIVSCVRVCVCGCACMHVHIIEVPCDTYAPPVSSRWMAQ